MGYRGIEGTLCQCCSGFTSGSYGLTKIDCFIHAFDAGKLAFDSVEFD